MMQQVARIAVAGVLAAFLFAFFVPVLPATSAVNCTPGVDLSTACLKPDGASYQWYQSIGYRLTGWGATGSVGWWSLSSDGYSAPLVTVDLGSTSCGLGCRLTNFGVFLDLVLPIIVTCAILVSPEVVTVSRASRVGFTALGGAVFALSVLVLASMLQQTKFSGDLALLSLFLAPAGVFMVEYGVLTGRTTRPGPAAGPGGDYEGRQGHRADGRKRRAIVAAATLLALVLVFTVPLVPLHQGPPSNPCELDGACSVQVPSTVSFSYYALGLGACLQGHHYLFDWYADEWGC